MHPRPRPTAALALIAAAALLASACQSTPTPASRPAPPIASPAPNNPPAAAPNSPPPFLQSLAPAAGEKLPLLEWDLRDGRTTANVDWPKNARDTETYRVQGDFQFQLELKEGQWFSARAAQVEAVRYDDKIESITLTTPHESTAEARDQLKTILPRLGCGDPELAQLESWYAQTQSGHLTDLQIKALNPSFRATTVHVTLQMAKLPLWSVQIGVDWNQACDCHD